jgi:Family of unknown function (DUF6491)
MPTLTRLMALVTALGLTAGCVAVPPSKEDLATEANFLKYAGPPIESFTYLGRYDGFRTVGDKVVVIFTTINDAYLIRVLDPCIQLRFADRVGLTSSSNTVNRHFDFVLADQVRCRIDTIQHIDYLAMKKARSAAS